MGSQAMEEKRANTTSAMLLAVAPDMAGNSHRIVYEHLWEHQVVG